MRTDAAAAFRLAAVLLVLGGPGAAQTLPNNAAPKLDPTEEVRPAYGETLRQRDRQRRDRAESEGASFIERMQGGAAPPPEPPARFSAKPPPRPAAEPAEPDPPDPPYETVREAAETGALPELVAALLEIWNAPPAFVRLRYPAPATDAAASPPGMPSAPAPALPEIRPGRSFYARALYEVNSDYPGPVVIEILEPPLAGAVATGGFQTVRDRMTLRLKSLAFRGANVPVDAWAVGLDCACFGVDAERDRHWIARVLLPAAFRFAEGFLESRSRPDETVRLAGGDAVAVRSAATARDDLYAGLGRSARSIGDILLEDAPKRPTVRIPRNAELAVMFAAPPGAVRSEAFPGTANRPPAGPAGSLRAAGPDAFRQPDADRRRRSLGRRSPAAHRERANRAAVRNRR